MADTDRKPKKIDLTEILGSSQEDAADPGDIVVLDASSGEIEPEAIPLAAPVAAATSEALQAAMAEKEKYYDLWVRARADFDNLRKRVERERDEERARAGAAVVKDLLPVADNFERALAGAPAEDPFREGMALIHRQLMDCLTRAGLEPIDAVGSVFNPVYHEAVVSERTDRIEPNRVLEEAQRGYMFRGRVLRPSLVKVSVAPEETSRQEVSDADTGQETIPEEPNEMRGGRDT